MQFSAPITLVGPSSSIAINHAGDSYFLTRLDGFDDAELRLTIDNKSRQDGAVVHSSYDGPIVGTADGYIKASTVNARNAAEHALRDFLNTIKTSDGTFQITEAGLALKSLTVRKYQKIVFAPRADDDTFVHTFQFMLVAANPVWS